METYKDVTPKEVAAEIQAAINQIRAALVSISLSAGDEWGEVFDEALNSVEEGIATMEKVVKEEV